MFAAFSLPFFLFFPFFLWTLSRRSHWRLPQAKVVSGPIKLRRGEGKKEEKERVCILYCTKRIKKEIKKERSGGPANLGPAPSLPPTLVALTCSHWRQPETRRHVNRDTTVQLSISARLSHWHSLVVFPPLPGTKEEGSQRPQARCSSASFLLQRGRNETRCLQRPCPRNEKGDRIAVASQRQRANRNANDGPAIVCSPPMLSSMLCWHGIIQGSYPCANIYWTTCLPHPELAGERLRLSKPTTRRGTRFGCSLSNCSIPH